MSNAKDYPEQIKKIVSKTKAGLLTLGIDAKLFLPDENASPLEMHIGYSLFRLTILHTDNNGNKNNVYANIPADDMFVIEKITNALTTEFMNRKLKPLVLNTINTETTNNTSVVNQTSPGYTVKIMNGTLKGKTPVQALLESSENKAKLEQQRNWLSSNLDRFPNNQKQIDAINDALKLLQENKIIQNNVINTPVTTTSSNAVDIYKVDIRIPNANRKDANGNTFIYSINISCDLEKKNPICINITNMLAPPIIDEIGMVKANLSKVASKKSLSINITFEEWLKVVGRMNNTLNNFETINFPKQLKICEQNRYKHE